ncbi:hypothetical protein Calhy_0784 [Caldicellulosiruptor hydrothermalis 108]|uniref:Phage-like element pbsx protein XkdT n=1 Tax=Caldicellulosiruptor hydrothermalis (strain DSM 18901 / VKM B-2411 / 108) TaxID=632292 RepID=E4QE27_CALH1|nr:YmfQ family protein [Caldicellulosiruptor hydrothermalis]ADQ06521.1 hypothetical protein Calhy_0784 [Caldicellulosiruptor hydrothermalis 108]
MSDVTKYVPEFLLQSKIFQTVYNIENDELTSVENAINDILNQCFIDTATWGLKYWEQLLNIPVDENKPADYRRSVIKSKIRGAGTITVSLIKTVAEAYSNGEVEVTENVAPYTFEVKFVGTRGIPPNLDDLKNIINEIKPAHLAVTYTFTYLIWDELDSKNLTWDQFDALGLTWDELEVLK